MKIKENKEQKPTHCPECESTQIFRSEDSHEDIWVCEVCDWEWENENKDSIMESKKLNEFVDLRKVKVGSVIHLKADENFDIAEGDYRVLSIPVAYNGEGGESDEDSFVLEDAHGIQGEYSMDYLENTGYWENAPQMVSHSFSMKESVNESKQRLNENNYLGIDGTLNFMRYEDDDVVKAIKDVFEKNDYSEFTLLNIHSNADQFYNLDLSFEIEEEEGNIFEFQKPLIVQKIHKLRSKLFADIASEIPVINSTISSISMVLPIAKFSITLLISRTNNKDWVTGKRKVVKESVETKQKDILTEGNVYLHEGKQLKYIKKIQGGRRFQNVKTNEFVSLREANVVDIKNMSSIEENIISILESSKKVDFDTLAFRLLDAFGGTISDEEESILIDKMMGWNLTDRQKTEVLELAFEYEQDTEQENEEEWDEQEWDEE